MSLIGLYNIEPKIINTALMQISMFHKLNADIVQWTVPLEFSTYDKVYCSSIFDYTIKQYIFNSNNIIYGGSGFNIKSRLPKEIEDCDYDYSIYPNCNYSIVWFSRGCIRNCSFCIVRQKEGNITSVKPKKLNPNSKWIIIQDNNFFANPNWRDAIYQLLEWGQPVNFQGVDIRLLNEEHLNILNRFKHKSQIKMAWDNPKEDLITRFKEVLKYIKPYKIMVYVLTGFNSTFEEDIYRVEKLRSLNLTPFVMLYKSKQQNKKLRDFQRWVNIKPLFKKIPWTIYWEHR